MRRVLILGAIIAAAIMLTVFLSPCFYQKYTIPSYSGIADAGEISGEVVVDHSSQSTIRRSEEDIPEITSTTMADYAYISHRERDTVRHDALGFWVPDTIEGRVHSNDTLRIGGGHFTRRVTSSMGLEISNDPQFDEGWGYAAPVLFPDQATNVRENAGLWLGAQGSDSLIQIVLDSTLIRWRKCGLVEINGADSIRCFPSSIAEANIAAIPSSGAVFVQGKVWISASRGRGDIMDGEFPERTADISNAFVSRGFEGQLTIGSSDTMIISDNLIYKHARPNFSVPPSIDSCPDILGLVSERFIMIHRQVRDTLYVHAAMAAIAGSISVQDIYWYSSPGWYNPKISLFIWGSLAQRNRGIMYTTWPCGLPNCERGFAHKKYHHDMRLRANPPPHFVPALSRYDLAGDTMHY
jgi:hypothetical protein